jgi:hypothetical protein
LQVNKGMHTPSKLNRKLWNRIYIRLKRIRQQPPQNDNPYNERMFQTVYILLATTMLYA